MLGMGVHDGRLRAGNRLVSSGAAGLARPTNTSGKFQNLSSVLGKALLIGCAAAFLAACGGAEKVQKSKFSPKKYGVKGSPKVVASGKPVPKGGGRYVVGKKYKIAGKWYYPKHEPNYKKTGLASWYGPTFHGRKTANGEIFDRNALTAAHTTMPLPSYARVTNTANGRSMIVRVNDRGPFHGNRIIDLSERVANMLGTKDKGVGKVKVEYVGRARLDGLDEEYLMASYRGPGATTPGGTLPGTLFAQAPVFGPAFAPAPRPYGRVVQVASAAYGQGAPAGTFDPALAFEANGATVKVASANTFRPAPVPAPVTAPAYQPQPAAYTAPAPSNQPGVLGTMRVPAAGTPRNLVPGSAVSSFAAERRIEAAHAVTAQMATESVPLSRLARQGN